MEGNVTELIQPTDKKRLPIFKLGLLIMLIVLVGIIGVFYLYETKTKQTSLVQVITEFYVDKNTNYRNDFGCVTQAMSGKTKYSFEYSTETEESKQKIRENCIPISAIK